MALNLSKLVPIYAAAIDNILEQMGKNVILTFGTAISTPTTDFDDNLRRDAQRKPDFKQTAIDLAPTRTTYTRTLKCLIKNNPKEFSNYGIRINDPKNATVRLKTYLTDVPDLRRCLYVQVHSDVGAIIDSKFKLIMEPIPTGLKVDRYAYTYWEHI